jgi:hypothetical protein
MNSRRNDARRHKAGIVWETKRKTPQAQANRRYRIDPALLAFAEPGIQINAQAARSCDMLFRDRSTMMKCVILTTVAALMLFGSAMANQRAAEENFRHDNLTIKLAMGPTSAPKLPGGTNQQPSCAQSNSCVKAHKTAKHRHKPASAN